MDTPRQSAVDGDHRHLRSPGVLLPLDTCRDLGLEHEQATGHSTTYSFGANAIFCDDCEYHLVVSSR